MNDSQIQAQAYTYFLTEAPELLQTIEQEILTLPRERTTAKVHNLMRALHTLKGAAANVGLKTIERIAHDFEDVTRIFYKLEIDINPSIQSLLLQGYAGLQECLDAQMMGRDIDEEAIVDRMTAAIHRLKVELDGFGDVDVELPSSTELGFDIVASIFETTVREQIDTLGAVIATNDPHQMQECLESIAEIGIGLAESFELSGFLEIQHSILAAIAHHPDRIGEIAALALQNLQQAQTQVLSTADRTYGGVVLPDLANLAKDRSIEPSAPQLAADLTPEPVAEFALALDRTPENATEELSRQIPLVAAGEAELPAFKAFLASDRFRKRHELSADTQHLFDRVLRICWDWFDREIHTPPSELNFELLVTAEGLADLDYLHHWIELLLQGVSTPGDRLSLQLYRQCCLYQVMFAVAKYLSELTPDRQITPEFLTQLRLHLQAVADKYQQQPSVTENERGWIDRIIIPHHWAKTSPPIVEEDLLLSEIWGQDNFSIS